MSLRFMSRSLYQTGMRAIQGIKDQASKCDSAFKPLRDSSASSCNSRLFSGAGGFKAASNDKVKQAEESLRTVMYLSCWGPN